MSELDPEARELMKLGRDASRPSDDARARSLAALRAKLGEAALSGRVGAGQAARWKSIALYAASGLVVSAIVAVVMLSRRTPPDAGPRLDAVPTIMAPTPSAALAVVPSVVTPAAPPEPRATASASAPAPSVSSRAERLAEEVAILARAAADLNSSRNAEALSELELHRKRFPNGQLTEERRAARARALCGLGRRAEAEAELARLARSMPSSPTLIRVRQACGLDPKP